MSKRHFSQRRQAVFLAIVALTAGALIWPGYMLVPGVRPLILGLPFSFAWVIGWIIVLFCGLLWLYLGETRKD